MSRQSEVTSQSHDEVTLLAVLRRETRLAFVANVIISVAAFLVVFGWHPVAVKSFASDFYSQSAGVAFIGTLIPALLLQNKVRRDEVVPTGRRAGARRLCAAFLAVVIIAAFVIGPVAAGVARMVAPAILTPSEALPIKALYGGVLAWLASPPIFRMILGLSPPGRNMFGSSRVD